VSAFKLTQAGSNLSESMSKVNAVFGESAFRIQEFSKTTAASLGITRQQTLEAAGTFGNLIQAFGIARTDAAAMSEEMVKLAADLASFNNVDIEEVFQALRSGLSGETEPLKRFGVAINDVRLKQEALNLGIYDGKGALDITAKTQAAYALILKDTALAQGDVERTSGGFANQMRFLRAALSDAAAELGLILLPYAERFVRFVNENIVPAVRAFADELDEGGLKSAIGAFVDALGPFGIQIKLFFANMRLQAAEAYKGVVDALLPAITLIDIVSGGLSAIFGGLGTQIMPNAIRAVGDAEDAVRQLELELGQAKMRTNELAKEKRILGAETSRYTELARSMKRAESDNTEETKKGAGASKAKKNAVEEAKRELEKYTSAMKSASRAQDSFNNAIKSTNKAQASLTEANARLADAQQKFNQAVAGYGADSVQAKDAQRALDAAQRGVERAGYRVEESVFAIADAERELAEIRSSPDANPQDIREAEIRLAEAKLSAADATDSQFEATQTLTQAQAILNEVVNGAIKGSETYETLSRDLADAQLRRADAEDAVTEALKRQAEAYEALLEAIEKTQGFSGRPGFATTVPNPVGSAVSGIGSSSSRFTAGSFMEAHNPAFPGTVNVTVNAGIGTSGVQVGQEINDYLTQYNRLNGGTFDRYGNIGIG
jgi:Txe/YoeB family toxin of Txe-Axe toxin-antitoxin module